MSLVKRRVILALDENVHRRLFRLEQPEEFMHRDSRRHDGRLVNMEHAHEVALLDDELAQCVCSRVQIIFVDKRGMGGRYQSSAVFAFPDIEEKTPLPGNR